LRRLITISVLAVSMVINHVGASTPKVLTNKETPKVVQKIKKVVYPVILFSRPIMLAWEKVNICEMGGNWHYIGPYYSGGLGMTNINWIKFGGLKFAKNAGLATPEEQVTIAREIEKSGYVPDQYGCGQGW